MTALAPPFQHPQAMPHTSGVPDLFQITVSRSSPKHQFRVISPDPAGMDI